MNKGFYKIPLMRFVLVFLILVICFGCAKLIINLRCSAFAEDEFVLISSAEDFKAFAAECNADSAKFANKEVFLTNDIDLSSEKLSDYIVTKFAGSFCGSYNGRHYKITGIKFDMEFSGGYIGLFQTLSGTGKVSDLSLYATFDGDSAVSASAKTYVAVLAGKAAGGSTINNCYINLDILNADKMTGEDNTGCELLGIAAYITGAVNFDNIYLETAGKTVPSYRAKNNVVVNIENFCYSHDGVEVENVRTDETGEYWTQLDDRSVLKIMLANASEETGGSGEYDQTKPDSPATTNITPVLQQEEYMYCAGAPVLQLEFDGTDDIVEYDLDFTSNSDFCVGKHYATVVLSDGQNFELNENVVEFEIVPHVIEIAWSNDKLIYNGSPQVPGFSFEKLEFAPDLELRYEQKFVEAGLHEAKLVAPANFMLSPANIEFEILPYTLEIVWSNLELTYNGDYQHPTANFEKNEITKM